MQTNKKMRTKAHVVGKHGTHHKVFLISGGRVIRERDTDMYLKYGWKDIARLGHWEGGFHFK